MKQFSAILVDDLLQKLQQHPYLGKSNPGWDREFILILLGLYGDADLRRELNKINAWCLANPEKAARKKNYRRFVLNWMNGRERKFVLSKGTEDA